MAIVITRRETDGIAILYLEGRIGRAEGADLRAALQELLAAGRQKLVVNLAGATFLDSAGLATLVTAYRSAQARGAALKLCSPGEQLREILKVTELLSVFEVHDSEEAALGSFQA